MKPRTVTTYKILAVAAAAAAGSTVALSTQAGGSSSPTTDTGAYQPLHDGDGYPLVGNLIRKGSGDEPRDAGREGGPAVTPRPLVATGER